tara:strand:+ start:99 stop:536 length:438 start_codon:yes stop_codon:yes gene_type:complete
MTDNVQNFPMAAAENTGGSKKKRAGSASSSVISNGIVKSNFYVKHELEIGNMTLILGIMSYIGINIQNNIIEQVAVNQGINEEFFTGYAILYLFKIATRLINMRLLMRTVTHKNRVKTAAIMIFVSNIILALSFVPYLVSPDSIL